MKSSWARSGRRWTQREWQDTGQDRGERPLFPGRVRQYSGQSSHAGHFFQPVITALKIFSGRGKGGDMCPGRGMGRQEGHRQQGEDVNAFFLDRPDRPRGLREWRNGRKALPSMKIFAMIALHGSREQGPVRPGKPFFPAGMSAFLSVRLRLEPMFCLFCLSVAGSVCQIRTVLVHARTFWHAPLVHGLPPLPGPDWPEGGPSLKGTGRFLPGYPAGMNTTSQDKKPNT